MEVMVHMEDGWWLKNKTIKVSKKLKERGNNYELWKFWWSICTTRIKK